MPHSNKALWIILIPKTGRLDSITGSSAQCMAQATEVAIPIMSQFTFVFIPLAKIVYLQCCCKNKGGKMSLNFNLYFSKMFAGNFAKI